MHTTVWQSCGRRTCSAVSRKLRLSLLERRALAAALPHRRRQEQKESPAESRKAQAGDLAQSSRDWLAKERVLDCVRPGDVRAVCPLVRESGGTSGAGVRRLPVVREQGRVSVLCLALGWACAVQVLPRRDCVMGVAVAGQASAASGASCWLAGVAGRLPDDTCSQELRVLSSTLSMPSMKTASLSSVKALLLLMVSGQI